MNKCRKLLAIAFSLLLPGWHAPVQAGVEALQVKPGAQAAQKKAGKKAEVRPDKKLTAAPAKPASTLDDASKRLADQQRQRHDTARQAIDNMK